jgi:Lrp/AsnC family transcriptional regulator, regulator for asnA, asnC and gidA
MPVAMMLDHTDRQIIRHLQGDGRMSYSQLGQLVGLSDAAARQRVNRLHSRGIIDIVAITDPVLVGLDFQALLGISVEGDARRVADQLAPIEPVVYVVLTAGRYEVLAEVVCLDTETFLELVNGTIRVMPGVRSVEVYPYMLVTKQTYDWGVG